MFVPFNVIQFLATNTHEVKMNQKYINFKGLSWFNFTEKVYEFSKENLIDRVTKDKSKALMQVLLDQQLLNAIFKADQESTHLYSMRDTLDWFGQPHLRDIINTNILG